MILASLVSVHVLGSLWFAVGDTEGGWVMEEQLHEDVLGALAGPADVAMCGSGSFRVILVGSGGNGSESCCT